MEMGVDPKPNPMAQTDSLPPWALGNFIWVNSKEKVHSQAQNLGGGEKWRQQLLPYLWSSAAGADSCTCGNSLQASASTNLGRV